MDYGTAAFKLKTLIDSGRVTSGFVSWGNLCKVIPPPFKFIIDSCHSAYYESHAPFTAVVKMEA